MLRLPHRRREIVWARALYDLYEGYSLASEAAHWWSKQPGAKAAKLAGEYRAVLIEIEEEISAALGGSPYAADAPLNSFDPHAR